MILFAKILLGNALGFLAHFLHHRFQRMAEQGTPAGWLNMARYAVGVVITLPVYILIRRNLHENEDINQDVKSFVLAFFSVAVGVAIGYLND